MAGNRKRFRRIDEPGHAHMLTWSCYRRQPFLRSERACQWLADSLVRAARAHDIDVWGYVFMPDHVHLLLFPRRTEESLSVAAQAIKQHVGREAVTWLTLNNPAGLARMLDQQPSGRSAQRFWQRGPGHDRNLVGAEAVHAELRYIHANPVRKELVARPEDWKWSSASAWESRKCGAIAIAFDTFPTLNAA